MRVTTHRGGPIFCVYRSPGRRLAIFQPGGCARLRMRSARAVPWLQRVVREYRIFVLAVFRTRTSFRMRRICCSPAHVASPRAGERAELSSARARISRRSAGLTGLLRDGATGLLHATVLHTKTGGRRAELAVRLSWARIFYPHGETPLLRLLDAGRVRLRPPVYGGCWRKTLIAAFALRGG